MLLRALWISGNISSGGKKRRNHTESTGFAGEVSAALPGYAPNQTIPRAFRPLRHFDDSLQLRATIAVRCARILGAQQARSDPQSVHLFADSQQFLLFHSQYVVRIFHWGRASTANSDLFRL